MLTCDSCCFTHPFFCFLQAIFNLLLPDHDANVFNPPQVGERGVLDWVVELAFGGCRRWDSLYFLHVAEHGYTYENSMAFFPLFPWLVRGLANSLLLPLQALISYGNVLLLSAVLLNIYCFTRAAQALFALGKKVLNNEALAYKAALLFCINPASIFMTAAYSESLFAMISFTAMCNFEGGSTVLGALQFGLTGLVRSNGIVSFGFVFYKKLKDFANMLMSMGKLKFTDIKSQVLITVSSLGIVVVPSLLYGILCCTPFALYQYYSYLMYCTDDKTNTIPETILKYGREQGFKLPDGTHSPWCRYSVPLSYSYIQSHHWNVGFLKYYQLKQIPNFLLASPMLVLCLALVRYYVSRNWRYSLTLGLEVPALNQGEGDRKNVTASGFESKNCFVFVVHLLFLVLFGTFFMHIQVSLSACSTDIG